MRENNRKCVICGTKYTYCSGCGEDNDKPAWMSTFHSQNCLDIYHITSNYIGGAITKEEAAEQLKQCDINITDQYNPVFKERIENILSENKDESKDENKEDNKLDGDVVENNVEINEAQEEIQKDLEHPDMVDVEENHIDQQSEDVVEEEIAVG